MITPPERTPDQDHLFAIASSQEGLFTTTQAAEAGYSLQLLAHHLRAGNMVRARRGIYRLVRFPGGEHEDMVAVWLWSEQQGVLSHLSALARHGLSDALPAVLHLTLPQAWELRRLRVPPGVVLHHRDLIPEDRTWFGPVPITSVARTLADCAEAGVSPELLRQACRQALGRGLVGQDDLTGLTAALEPFGGLST